MPLTFLAAKQDVARNVGGSAIAAQTTIAGSAIIDAIRELDFRHDWEFQLVTLADITVVAGTATYALTPGGSNPPVKKIHSARLKTNKRTLVYARQRHVDRIVRNQEQVDIPVAYMEVRSATGVSIQLVPPPSQGDILQVRTFLHIDDTYADGDSLNVPDRYLPALLALARYNFLIDRDSDDSRAQTFLAKAEQRIQDAINDDMGNPDEDFRLIPSDEWNYAFGPNPITDLMDVDF